MEKTARLLNSLKKKRVAQMMTLSLIVFFYFMGCFGILTPEQFARSVSLTPFIITLSLLVVLIFSEAPWKLRTILMYLLITALGYLVEVLGSNTHMIFGSYTYGKTLGFKLFNTPLLIGLNWLFLVYASASVLEHFKLHVVLKIILSSLIMLVYDIILEPVAMKTDMWHWNNSTVPVRNYIAWFVIAIVLHTILKSANISTRNPIAGFVLLCQFLFFLTLHIFLK